jgi:hypothetical protein
VARPETTPRSTLDSSTAAFPRSLHAYHLARYRTGDAHHEPARMCRSLQPSAAGALAPARDANRCLADYDSSSEPLTAAPDAAHGKRQSVRYHALFVIDLGSRRVWHWPAIRRSVRSAEFAILRDWYAPCCRYSAHRRTVPGCATRSRRCAANDTRLLMTRNSTRPLFSIGLLASAALISGADGGGCGRSHDEGSAMAPSGGASGAAGSSTVAGAATGAGRGAPAGPVGGRAAAGRGSSGAGAEASAGRGSPAGAGRESSAGRGSPAGATTGAGNGSGDADGGAACVADEGEHCGGNIANPCSCAAGLVCTSSAGGPAAGDVGGTCKPAAQGGACSRDADCTLKADYCTGCDCVALAPGQNLRPCSGPGVQCFADPCGMKTAACQNGTCVAR